MAGPVVHGAFTLPISIAAFLLGGWQWATQASVWFLGLSLDFDHLFSRERIRRLLEGDKTPVAGQIYRLHTWTALGGVIAFCFLINNWFTLISFMTHNYIDAGDAWLEDEVDAKPLSEFLRRFFPRQWEYRTKTETGILAKMFSWPQKIKKFFRREK